MGSLIINNKVKFSVFLDTTLVGEEGGSTPYSFIIGYVVHYFSRF